MDIKEIEDWLEPQLKIPGVTEILKFLLKCYWSNIRMVDLRAKVIPMVGNTLQKC